LTACTVTPAAAVVLGQTRPFDAVRLFPARPYDWQPDTPGFLYPLRFKFEAASCEDFSDARVLLDLTAMDQPNPGTNAPTYRFSPTTARFVRLSVTRLRQRDGQNFAFALAEMKVLSGETNLAESARVLALDSIETGAWAKTNLTDGAQETFKPDATGALPVTLVRNATNGSVGWATFRPSPKPPASTWTWPHSSPSSPRTSTTIRPTTDAFRILPATLECSRFSLHHRGAVTSR
jgi:hypothetical protein